MRRTLPRRRTLPLVAALVLLPAGPALAASTAPRDTGVVNVSRTDDFSEGEEPLSVNPLNPAEMTTVANVFQPNAPGALGQYFGGGGFQDTRVYSTRDGGIHWTTRKLDQGGLGPLDSPLPVALGFAPEFSDAFNIINTDADSVWDRHGNAFFESGDIHGIAHGGDETETVWRSRDGGLTWGPKRGFSAVSNLAEHEELDRPWLAMDNSGGRYDGTFYTTFETSPFVDDPPKVFIKRSTDLGETWTKTVRVDSGTYETQFNPRNRPVVGADGAVYVVYVRARFTVTPFLPQDSPIHLVMARSADGGRSFKTFEADGDVHRVTSPDEATPQYTEMIPAIATDPGHAGRVALAWPEATGPNSSRIAMRTSSDGGEHWSPRIDVADDPAAKADQHDHVTLAWLSDGRLFVGWRDRRCCGGTFTSRYQQWVRAFDPTATGGLRPVKTVEFSAGPLLAPTGDGRGILQPDEFQGLVATRLGVGLTWSQLNGKLDDLMFRRVPLASFGCATLLRGAKCVKQRRKGKAVMRTRKHPKG